MQGTRMDEEPKTVETSTTLPKEEELTTSSMIAFVSNCPPGLQHLASLDGFYVHQLMDMFEIFTGIETNNRYEIMDAYGHRIFFAAETTNACVTITAGANRPFIIQVLNFVGAPILTISRDCTFSVACGCGCCCGGNRVDVTHISGVLLGSAIQTFGCITPSFQIIDDKGEVCLLIHGPCCACCLGACCTADFHIMLPDDETEIGVIQKQASMREIISDANTFGVSFPINLSPKLKSLILAAVFVIDFGYFEGGGGHS